MPFIPGGVRLISIVWLISEDNSPRAIESALELRPDPRQHGCSQEGVKVLWTIGYNRPMLYYKTFAKDNNLLTSIVASHFSCSCSLSSD